MWAKEPFKGICTLVNTGRDVDRKEGRRCFRKESRPCGGDTSTVSADTGSPVPTSAAPWSRLEARVPCVSWCHGSRQELRPALHPMAVELRSVILTLLLLLCFQKDEAFTAVPTLLSSPPAPATPLSPATPASSASPGTPCTPSSTSPSGIVKRKTGQPVSFCL